MDNPKCELCGEPMPNGEGMFKVHGYSCPCPKPPLPLVSQVVDAIKTGGWNRDLATRIIEIVRAHDAKQKAGE